MKSSDSEGDEVSSLNKYVGGGVISLLDVEEKRKERSTEPGGGRSSDISAQNVRD
jgi:hypothetical protein